MYILFVMPGCTGCAILTLHLWNFLTPCLEILGWNSASAGHIGLEFLWPFLKELLLTTSHPTHLPFSLPDLHSSLAFINLKVSPAPVLGHIMGHHESIIQYLLNNHNNNKNDDTFFLI